MRSHLKCLGYTLRHKWYVFLSCLELAGTQESMATALMLIWLGLIHDISKFSPREWNAYRHRFHGPKSYPTCADLPLLLAHEPDWKGMTEEQVHQRFRCASNNHVKVNLHHWEHWCEFVDGSYVRPLAMPRIYRLELLADWMAMSRQQGKDPIGGARGWYTENQERIRLHPETARWLCRRLEMDPKPLKQVA